jgi:hypothetical protein
MLRRSFECLGGRCRADVKVGSDADGERRDPWREDGKLESETVDIRGLRQEPPESSRPIPAIERAQNGLGNPTADAVGSTAPLRRPSRNSRSHRWVDNVQEGGRCFLIVGLRKGL